MKVLLIVLTVIFGVIAVIYAFLRISVRIHLKADNNALNIDVRYLGHSFYKFRYPDKEKKTQQEKKPDVVLTEVQESANTAKKSNDSALNNNVSKTSEDSKKAEKIDSEVGSESKEDKPSLLDKFNAVKVYIPAAKKAFIKLLKLIRFYDLDINMIIGDTDAYEAGLKFGRINAVFYSVLGLLCCIFSVSIKRSDIKCDFDSKRFDFSVSTVIYIRPSTLIALAAYIGVYYLKIKKSIKKLENKEKETVSNE